MKRIVPGVHSVAELLKINPKAVKELWLKEGELNPDLKACHQVASQKHIPIKRVSVKAIEKHAATHQGVLAFAEGSLRWPTRDEFRGFSTGLILALDQLEDPHNVGSLVRTAWNLGAIGVVSSRTPMFAPAAQKVASGGFEHVPVLEVSNLHADLMGLKELGFWVFGLEMSGADSIYNIKFPEKAVIVIGSEEAGLRKPVVSACDALVSIPQVAGASSFNASVAGAIAAFEFSRQRSIP